MDRDRKRALGGVIATLVIYLWVAWLSSIP
jgi:hypothetical protein